MSGTKRKVFGAEFKAKVGLEAIHGVKTINQIAQDHGVHLVQVSQWKKEILERAGTLFEGKRGPKPVSEYSEPERLYGEIGKLKMVSFLKTRGHRVNRKRVRRLMRILGLAGMAPGPDTSRPHPQHKVYPYLLRGVMVMRPNQVWSTDITYIRLAHGFVYLVAVIDWYSRRVLNGTVSTGYNQ